MRESKGPPASSHKKTTWIVLVFCFNVNRHTCVEILTIIWQHAFHTCRHNKKSHSDLTELRFIHKQAACTHKFQQCKFGRSSRACMEVSFHLLQRSSPLFLPYLLHSSILKLNNGFIVSVEGQHGKCPRATQTSTN